MEGRAKGSSVPDWNSPLRGEVGRECTGVDAADATEDEGVMGKGTEDPGKDLFTGERIRLGIERDDEGESRSERALEDMGVVGLFEAGKRGKAAKGTFGIGEGVGEAVLDVSRLLTRSLVCKATHLSRRSVMTFRRFCAPLVHCPVAAIPFAFESIEIPIP